MVKHTEIEWESFKKNHRRKYQGVDDERKHFEQFQEALRTISENNVKFNDGLSSFSLGLTKFADWTDEDIAAYFQPVNVEGYDISDRTRLETSTVGEFPESIDWSASNNPLKRSVVSKVKDQEQCGACWAFAATESTECSVAINTGVILSLSVQELIDCDHSLNKGCVGGNPVFAFPYIQNKGLTSENHYPYTGLEGECKRKKSMAGINGYRTLRPRTELSLANALAHNPLAVGLSGTKKSFLLYSGGIYDDSDCGIELNHAALLVGLGTTPDGDQYWILKNSWGTSWGEQGFMRLRRNSGLREGLCGIAVAPTFAIGGYGNVTESNSLRHTRAVPRSWLQMISFAVSAFCMALLSLIYVKERLRHRRNLASHTEEAPGVLVVIPAGPMHLRCLAEERDQPAQGALSASYGTC